MDRKVDLYRTGRLTNLAHVCVAEYAKTCEQRGCATLHSPKLHAYNTTGTTLLCRLATELRACFRLSWLHEKKFKKILMVNGVDGVPHHFSVCH